MNNNRLGCLTSTGIFAALVTVVAIVGVAFASGSQMFSAGPLNAQAGEEMLGGVTSHAQIAECNACHTAPWERASMADRCANCHQEIVAQMKDVAQLHGAIFHRNPNLSCRHCHPEHRGATTALTVMSEGDFPHDAFGFSLTGHKRTAQNQPFTCKDCHNEDITTFAPDTCVNCHGQMDMAFTQAHVLGFGTDCFACHDGVDRYGRNFGHNSFPFQLIGKHKEAPCTKCHLDAHTIVSLQSAPQDCFSCHKQDDPHAGRYGTDCGTCHSPEGWKPAKFDHNLAAFKLEGGHVEVRCEQCHINNVFKGTPSDCYSCHKNDDEHNGQFGTKCEVCHSPEGWEMTTFDHNLSSFKLQGKHANVKCEACHLNNIFKGTPQDCHSCHQKDDKHNGQFGTDCSACHTVDGWDKVTFDHSRTSFPLTGGHADIPCERCHQGGQFQKISTNCASCHADPAFHTGAIGTDCASCHNSMTWSPARFNLSHPQPSAEEGGSGVNHGGSTCKTCHPNTVHEYTCLACHQSNNFGEGGGD